MNQLLADKTETSMKNSLQKMPCRQNWQGQHGGWPARIIPVCFANWIDMDVAPPPSQEYNNFTANTISLCFFSKSRKIRQNNILRKET